MGDFINRAIFTNSELIDGIEYLLSKGFITEKDSFLKTTEEFVIPYKETTKKMKYTSKRISIDVIEQVLLSIAN